MTRIRQSISVIGAFGLVAFALPSMAEKGSAPAGWYRGNTHTHTLNSDGNASPAEVAGWYREHAYQFVVITDHDYLTEVAPLNALLGATEQFLVLPGQEVTQWSDDPTRDATRVNEQIGASAHINALFIDKLVDPVGVRPCAERWCGANAPASMPIGDTFPLNIAAVRAANGIAQINHPNSLWSLKPTDLAGVPDGVLIEIWNGAGSVIHNLGGDDGHGDVRPSAEGFWDGLLSQGKLVWGVAADDSHAFQAADLSDPAKSHPGKAWIMVRAKSLSILDLKTAMARGEFYASTGIQLDDIAVTRVQVSIQIRPESMALPHWQPPRYATRFIGQDGKVLATVAGTHPVYRFKGSENYVRAVVTDSNGKQAWTQPAFLGRRQEISPFTKE